MCLTLTLTKFKSLSLDIHRLWNLLVYINHWNFCMIMEYDRGQKCQNKWIRPYANALPIFSLFGMWNSLLPKQIDEALCILAAEHLSHCFITVLHKFHSIFQNFGCLNHSLSVLEFVKKFTRPNLRAKEFYTLKTHKSRLFSPAIDSKNASLSVIWPSFGWNWTACVNSLTVMKKVYI